jgi:ribosome-binding protein aMBF1 (putative translation factor)
MFGIHVFLLEKQPFIPTEVFRTEVRIPGQVGYDRFSAMSESGKKSTSETLGLIGVVTAGGCIAVGAVSVADSVEGLSAAELTSGLAAIGGTILGRLLVVIATPVIVRLGGYRLVKGVKAICAQNNLKLMDIDGQYEKVVDHDGDSVNHDDDCDRAGKPPGWLMSAWDYENEDQKMKMEELITPETCGEKLRLVRDVSGLSRRDLAKILGCSESTISRLETKKTLPSIDFTNRLRALVLIGYHKFVKMSDSQKSSLSETIGSIGGVAAGIAGSIGTVSAAGAVAGLSAAGITSGLAAIGGGAMIAGVAVVAAIPAAIGLGGYGLVKGIKAICKANNLNCKDVDGRYEIVSTTRGVTDLLINGD